MVKHEDCVVVAKDAEGLGTEVGLIVTTWRDILVKSRRRLKNWKRKIEVQDEDFVCIWRQRWNAVYACHKRTVLYGTPLSI
jgi:hypothetical protein